MTHRRLVAGAALLTILLGGPALAASDNGFAAFWKAFTAAMATDDQKALAGMVQISPDLDQNPVPKTFAQFHARRLTPRTRRCLAQAKPVRGVDGYGQVNYSAFCGQLDFVFYRTPDGWRLTDTGADD